MLLNKCVYIRNEIESNWSCRWDSKIPCWLNHWVVKLKLVLVRNQPTNWFVTCETTQLPVCGLQICRSTFRLACVFLLIALYKSSIYSYMFLGIFGNLHTLINLCSYILYELLEILRYVLEWIPMWLLNCTYLYTRLSHWLLDMIAVASEAYHDWSGEAVGARLRVNFTLKLLLSQNFCNWPLMRFISFASHIGPAAAVPAGPAPAPLDS